MLNPAVGSGVTLGTVNGAGLFVSAFGAGFGAVGRVGGALGVLAFIFT